MSRAVVFTYPDPSHVSASLPVFAELVRRGEAVTIYSTAPYRAAIEDAGATYRGYDATMSASSTGPFGGMHRRLEFAEQLLPDAIEALRLGRPDYLVMDAAAIWGSVASGLLQIPTVSYRITMALHRDMLADYGLARKFYCQAPQQFVFQGMLDLIGYFEAAQRIDRQYGSRTGDMGLSLECRHDLNLVLISRALQMEAERFDDTYRFAGRCLDERPEPDQFPWDELGSDPLIYISLGTVFNDRPEFFRACMEAFGGLRLRVVMSVGRRVDPKALGPAPANFLLAPFVPQVKLLERATLAITHGGSNSIEECVRAGVPQLLYPQAGDHFLMADVVERLGAGVRLYDADIEGRRLRELAQRVMADPSYSRAAATLSESVRQSGGTAEACTEILAFAARVAR